VKTWERPPQSTYADGLYGVVFIGQSDIEGLGNHTARRR